MTDEDRTTSDTPTSDPTAADDPTAAATPPDLEDDPDWLEPEDCTDEELGVGTPYPAWIVAANRRHHRQVRERWRYLPDDPLPQSPPVGPATVGTVVRALRWRAGLSQRELAVVAGLPPSAVTRAEQAGGADLRLSTLERLVEAAGLQLAVVDEEGTQLAIPFDQSGRRDGADRRLPAHRAQGARQREWAVGVERGTARRLPAT